MKHLAAGSGNPAALITQRMPIFLLVLGADPAFPKLVLDGMFHQLEYSSCYTVTAAASSADSEAAPQQGLNAGLGHPPPCKEKLRRSLKYIKYACETCNVCLNKHPVRFSIASNLKKRHKVIFASL